MSEIKIGLACFTDGRKGLIDRTLNSFFDNITSSSKDIIIQNVIVTDDSGDRGFHEYLHTVVGDVPSLQGASVSYHFHPKRLGFGKSIRKTWEDILLFHPDLDFIFHLEDDFLFNRKFDINDLVSLLTLKLDHKLAQVAFQRQAWNEQEKAAGGLVKAHPGQYKQRYSVYSCGEVIKEVPWLLHRRCFTTNPCLYPIEIVERGWPDESESEGKFGIKLVQDNWEFAMYGCLDDPPMVHHIGDQRIGGGY